jgi:hypothetical protein
MADATAFSAHLKSQRTALSPNARYPSSLLGQRIHQVQHRYSPAQVVLEEI